MEHSSLIYMSSKLWLFADNFKVVNSEHLPYLILYESTHMFLFNKDRAKEGKVTGQDFFSLSILRGFHQLKR